MHVGVARSLARFSQKSRTTTEQRNPASAPAMLSCANAAEPQPPDLLPATWTRHCWLIFRVARRGAVVYEYSRHQSKKQQTPRTETKPLLAVAAQVLRPASIKHYKEEAASRQLSYSAALKNKC